MRSNRVSINGPEWVYVASHMTWSVRWGRFGPTACRQRACESCGQPFRCEVSLGGCWCQEVKLSDAARSRIRARYANCLCRDCLNRYSREGELTGAFVASGRSEIE